jgi:Leucine-rich repeat (LRR) protein
VPEGVSYGLFDQQIILPTIYAKAKNYSPLQALDALKLKQFFASVKTLFNPETELITQIKTT